MRLVKFKYYPSLIVLLLKAIKMVENAYNYSIEGSDHAVRCSHCGKLVNFFGVLPRYGVFECIDCIRSNAPDNSNMPILKAVKVNEAQQLNMFCDGDHCEIVFGDNDGQDKST